MPGNNRNFNVKISFSLDKHETVAQGTFLKTHKKQQQGTLQSSEIIAELESPPVYIRKGTMEIVPVEEKLNQVAAAAPSEIGRVIESDVDTTEESTSSEISRDEENLKHQEQIEEYEAKGTAKIVGTQGQTLSKAEAKSKQSEAVTESTEGNRKVLSSKTTSSKCYSFEETTEYEC